MGPPAFESSFPVDFRPHVVFENWFRKQQLKENFYSHFNWMYLGSLLTAAFMRQYGRSIILFRPSYEDSRIFVRGPVRPYVRVCMSVCPCVRPSITIGEKPPKTAIWAKINKAAMCWSMRDASICRAGLLHLYMRVCPPLRPCMNVRLSVTIEEKSPKTAIWA